MPAIFPYFASIRYFHLIPFRALTTLVSEMSMEEVQHRVENLEKELVCRFTKMLDRLSVLEERGKGP